jgi:hypothetical protein
MTPALGAWATATLGTSSKMDRLKARHRRTIKAGTLTNVASPLCSRFDNARKIAGLRNYTTTWACQFRVVD